MPRHFKVHEVVKDDVELEELRAFARQPARTIDELHDWLLAKGYTVSRGAVHNWKQAFDEELLRERTSGAGSLARAFKDATQSSGGLDVPDAAVQMVVQLIFEACAQKSLKGEVESKDLATLALAMQRATLAKARVEDVRGEFLDREKQALAAGERAAKDGKAAGSVVDAIKQALGITGGAA